MLELLLNGLFVGALFALFGLGLAVTFGLMRQINLAHGDLIVLAAYSSHVLVAFSGLPPLATVPIVATGLFIVGWVLQRTVLDPVLGRGVLPPLLVTFGLSILLQNLMQLGFSADTRSLDPGALGSVAVHLGGLSLGLMPILFFVLAVVVFGAVALMLGRTRFGLALRATTDDRQTSRQMGILTRRIFAAATGLSLATSAMAAVFLGMRSTFAPTSGPELLLFAFEAVVLGGLGSIWGTLAGGMLLGLAQALGQAIAPEFGPLAGHLAFLAVLLIRPTGLFSREVAYR